MRKPVHRQFAKSAGPAALLACAALAFAPASFGESALSKLTKALNTLAGASKAGNLILNGSFEEPVVPKGRYQLFQTGQSFPGWQVMGAPGNVAPISGEYASGGIRFNAQQGSQWNDMTGLSNSATGVQQTVRTEAGRTYHLTFWVGNVVGGGFGTSSSIEVVVDGKSLGVATNDINMKGQQSWGRFDKTVTATSASMTIAFINRDPPNDNSNGLDNVTLVPEAGAATGAAVLTESFEAPVTGNYTTYNAGQSFSTGANTWIVPTSGVDVVNSRARPEVAAFDGNQSIDLTGSPGAGVLATSFATKPGQKYNLTFQYARNNGLRSTPGQAKVEVQGTGTLLAADIRHDASVGTFSTFRPFTGSFVADGPTATLRFTSLNPGNAGIVIDAVSITAAGDKPATAPVGNLGGEYSYLGKGEATVTQNGNDIQVEATWPPAGKGPHYSFKGKLEGDTITGEWYSFYAGKGWFKWVAKVLPNGDIDFSKSEDPIKTNVRSMVLTRKP